MSNSQFPKTISIVGGTLWGNRGAEAMLVTTIGQIRHRYPSARFQVFSYYPKRDQAICTDQNIQFYNCQPLNLALKIVPLALFSWLFSWVGLRVPDRWVGQEVRALRRSDLLCDIGGITFCDGRVIFLLFNVLSLLPAMLLGIPVIKLSQAMGPFRHPINRFFSWQILSRCKMIFARGNVTARHLQELNLDSSNWQLASDVAFSYESSFSLTRENEGPINKIEQQLLNDRQNSFCNVTVIPSSLLLQKSADYVTKMSDLILELSKQGFHVLMLPNATREGSEKARNNDIVVIQQIKNKVTRQNPSLSETVVAVDFDLNTEGIRRLMRHTDLVVTSRFHGMVAAMSESIPVVVIGWSHKYKEVLAPFQCEHQCFDHRVKSDSIHPLILQLVADKQNQANLIRKCQVGVQRSSLAQFNAVFDVLGPTNDLVARPGQPTTETSTPVPFQESI